MSEPTEKDIPRLRLATDIDLSKAKKSCKGCGGSGIKENRIIEDPENPGGKRTVPVICKCISRRGGVKKDQLDRIMEETAKQLEDGTFARDMAKDIMGLPVEAQGEAIMQIKRRAADKKENATVRQASFAALKLLQN